MPDPQEQLIILIPDRELTLSVKITDVIPKRNYDAWLCDKLSASLHTLEL